MKKYLISLSFLLVSLFIGINKVNALTLFDGTEVPDVPSVITENDYPFYITAYTSNELRLIYQTSSNLYLSSANPNSWVNGTVYSLPITVNNSGNIISVGNTWTRKGTIAQGYGCWWRSDTEILNSLNNVYGVSTDYKHAYFNRNILLSNNTILNDISLYSAYLPSQLPSKITFTPMPIYDTDNAGDNYVSEMNIGVNFDIYDDENYNYYYQFNSNTWTMFEQNDQIINFIQNGTLYVKVTDKENNYITGATSTISSIDDTPKIYYEIEINEEETSKRKDNRYIYNIKLTYKNMTDDYYSIYYNMRDGTSKNLGYNVQNYTINNVNDDALFTVLIYDDNDTKIDQVTIDVSLFRKDLNEPYIRIIGRDFINLHNTVSYSYNNTNDNDYTCYYQFGGDSEKTQESCSPNNIITRHAAYNTYLQIFIYDSNNKIVDKKNVNLMFFTGYPRLNFESYYSGISKSQVLDITMLDFNADKDTLFYSTDKENWEQLATQEKNTLYFTKDTDVYFKIYRENEPVGDAFYHVVVGTYSISISENKTTKEIHALTSDKTSDYVKSFLNEVSLYAKEFSKLITYFFNSLNGTLKSFLIALFVIGLLCSIIMIARGRR